MEMSNTTSDIETQTDEVLVVFVLSIVAVLFLISFFAYIFEYCVRTNWGYVGVEHDEQRFLSDSGDSSAHSESVD